MELLCKLPNPVTGLELYFLGDHVEGDFTLKCQVLFLCGGGLEIKKHGINI